MWQGSRLDDVAETETYAVFFASSTVVLAFLACVLYVCTWCVFPILLYCPYSRCVPLCRLGCFRSCSSYLFLFSTCASWLHCVALLAPLFVLRLIFRIAVVLLSCLGCFVVFSYPVR